ncbi:MAG: cupin domain-containing protein [Myxococcota bacterium]|nr:cupin domain-containing protein [Myxococcota bacterium]
MAASGEPESKRAVVVHESECPLESWAEETRSRVEWRMLLSGERTPSHSLTMGVAEVQPQPDPTEPPTTHWHPQVEAYYVLSGEGELFAGEDRHLLRPGSSVFLPGETEHGVRNTGSEVLRILFVFATDAFPDVDYHFPESGPIRG